MQSTNPQLDPGPILQTAFAFWSSKVLLTAVEFDVFTKLGNRRMTGAELGAEHLHLGCRDRYGPMPRRTDFMPCRVAGGDRPRPVSLLRFNSARH